MPKRACLEPRCPNYARPGSPRCDEHAKRSERERGRRRRAAGKTKVYASKRWAMARKRKLDRNPVCEECGNELAAEVDHVVPLTDGGAPFALDNLRSLCAPCHWTKTAQENRERAAQGA